MPSTLNLEGLFLFTKVVEAGSFSEVCKRFKIPKATLSRKIRQLEGELGAQLLVRNTRILQPTELGRDLLGRAIAILAAVDESKELVRRTQAEPQGKLRISAGVEFGVHVLSPLVAEFLDHYPKLEVELDLTGRRVDLIYEGFDLGIRIGPLTDSTLGSRQLGNFCYHLYAAPTLVRRFGPPRSPQALARWPKLGFTRANKSEEWRLISGAKFEALKFSPRLSSNNYWVLQNAALKGLGAVFMPSFLVSEAVRAKRLVPLLPEWSSEKISIHALYPQQKFLAGKTRLFIDFVVERLQGFESSRKEVRK